MTDDNLSDEDKALFRAHMRSVKPLNKKELVKSEKIRPVPIKKITHPSVAPPKKSIPLSDFIQEPIQSDTQLKWYRHSLPTARLRALKNGAIPWEGRLDLHGLRPDPAREAVCDFILNQHSQGRRCLLLIHGRGSYQGEPPVLKNLINRWLPQFDEVLAFHSAHPKDGGLGAVYVLLKRQRDD